MPRTIAGTAAKEDQAASAGYGTEAAGIGSRLVPTMEQWMAKGGPGFGTPGLMQMQSGAQEANQAVRGAMAEKARLRGSLTRNVGAVSGQQDAMSEAAARGQGAEIQNILGANAQLKAREQGMAAQQLGSLYGKNLQAQVGMAGIVPRDVMAEVQAGRAPWQNFANLMGGLQAGAKGGAAIMGALGL